MIQATRDKINDWFDGWASKCVLAVITSVIIGWTSWCSGRLLDDRARIIQLEENNKTRVVVVDQVKQDVADIKTMLRKINDDQMAYFRERSDSPRWRQGR